ncbi:MAG: sensor histidine kinase [Gemmatimonadetes bacterium]|nr:sensor histidine kinase [Gemmatimonadota bacterium]
MIDRPDSPATAQSFVRGFRLLPQDQLGWTPFIWLVYFPFFFVTPVLGRAGAGEWAATVLGAIAFLALYFRGHWARGRELLAITVMIAVLGFAFLPHNVGASVLLTYAAAFCAKLRPRRRAIVGLYLLGFSIAIAGAALGLMPNGFWGFELLLAMTIGASNLHFEKVRDTNRELRRAHEEIGHLARVAERERIARDLHDVLGHTLTLITLKSALAARLAERDPMRAAAEMRDVERVSRDALKEVRSAVAGQREVGLARELANAREMLGAAGIAVEHAASPVALSPTEEAMLALAMREAVTNVVRHAGASNCRITLSTDGSTRLLAVEDDGRGKRAPDGNGIAGMRERVSALGGRLEVDSPGLAGNGTRVQITLARAAS